MDYVGKIPKWQTPPPTVGEHWLLKQFSLNHSVEHLQKPKLAKRYVSIEICTSYFIREVFK